MKKVFSFLIILFASLSIAQCIPIIVENRSDVGMNVIYEMIDGRVVLGGEVHFVTSIVRITQVAAGGIVEIETKNYPQASNFKVVPSEGDDLMNAFSNFESIQIRTGQEDNRVYAFTIRDGVIGEAR